jgi:transposase
MTNNTTTGTGRKAPGTLLYVGLDVHKETIAVAVAELGKPDAQVLGVIRNDADALRALMRKLRPAGQLHVCYEAGPCGYVIQRCLQRMKIDCVVVAPSLIPRKPGDRIKTDRRDARKLAVLLRSGDLTPVWVPDRDHEALRDVVRAREDVNADLLRARHRFTNFLLRIGARPPEGVNAWTLRYRDWLKKLTWPQAAQRTVFAEDLQAIDECCLRLDRLDREIEGLAKTSAHAATIAALQALRGVQVLTAATIVAETGDLSRFRSPRELMSYAGLIPSEHSSGGRVRRGAITKVGNAHLRRVLIESAWHYRHQPHVSQQLRRRQQDLPAAAVAIAWNAQERLYKRYHRLLARGKPSPKICVAVGRELLGFVWAIDHAVRDASQPTTKAA